MHTSASVSIGRDPDADLQLDHPSVSPKHAAFFMVGGDYCIKDLGSRTGTWVNGSPTVGSPALGPTDEVTVGVFRLRIKIHRATISDLVTVTHTLPLRPPPAPRPDTDADDLDRLLRTFDEHPAAEVAPSVGGADAPAEIPAAPMATPRHDTAPLPWAPASRSGAPLLAQAVTPSRVPAAPAVSLRAKTTTVSTELPTAKAFARVQPSALPELGAAASSIPSAVGRPRAPEEPAPTGWSAGWNDDEDEDDDDSSFVPSFDLLEALSVRGLPAGVPAKDAVVEVIEFTRDRVTSVRHLGPRQDFRLPGSEVTVGRSTQTSGFVVETKIAGSFTVWQAGRKLSPLEVEQLAGSGALGLAPGMQLVIDVRGDDKVMLHLVQRAPAVARPRISLAVDKSGLTSGASSTLAHVVMLTLIGLFAMSDKVHEEADLNAGRFATIDMKELELEPPPPEPDPVPIPEAETPAPTTPTTPPPTTPRLKKQVATAKNMPRSSKAAAGSEQPAPSTSKILSSLTNATPSTATATAITNLDAAPHGAGGGFKISGAIGKAPGNGLKIAAAGSGSGQVNTKSATEVGANVGHVKGQRGTGTVRARVTAIPQAISGEGHLGRGEIQRVVNAHVHQVQACYERQLMKDPSLGGKITLEWVIASSGGVSSVRVKQSTVRSSDVASCIQSAVRGWKFPSPKGGAVTVTYPFAFSTLGN